MKNYRFLKAKIQSLRSFFNKVILMNKNTIQKHPVFLFFVGIVGATETVYDIKKIMIFENIKNYVINVIVR